MEKSEHTLKHNSADFDLSQEKILVTGGTGFLGSYIIKQLIEQGYEVRAIRRTDKLPFWIDASILKKVEWIEGDVLDVVSLQDAMDGVSTIIHSAAIVSFAKKDRKRMYQVNVDGTANVVNIALEKNIHRLIHVSSVAALGRDAHGGKVDEEKKWQESKINTHYAISKYKAELHAWRGFAEGLEGVIVNPATILGYGDWHSSSCGIFKKIYDGFNWFTSGINGFVAVEDVASATIQLMKSPITEERFIVSGDNWTFQQLQNAIATGFQKKQPQKIATPFLMAIAWRMEKLKAFFTRKKLLLTRESARVAMSKTFFDNKKLLQALPGFSFTPLVESIKNACKKYSPDS